MNKKELKKRSLQLLAILLLISNVNCWASKAECIKKREMHESFKVSPSDLLMVDNLYGNITVTHWDKHEASIQVMIEVKAPTEADAQATIDRIKVEIKKSGSTVSAITSLKEPSNKNYYNNVSLNINYFINVPFKLTTDLNQRYGNIILPDKNEGKSNIRIKYGNLNANSFTASLNLEMKYGNADLEDISDAMLDLSYCGKVNIKNATKLNVDSKYSNTDIQDCRQINLENKYGNIKIQNVNVAYLNLKYSEASIGTVKEEVNIDDLSYTTLTVKELSANFKKVNVEGRYANLNLGIPENASFNVAAENMKYGNYNIKGFNITHSSVEEKVNHYSEINNGKGGKIYFNGNSYSNLKINAL